MSEFTNEILENIWKDRYRKNNESFKDNLRRVANYCGKTDDEKRDFYNIMNKRFFFPAGRTMSNSGIGRSLTLNNCFVAPQLSDDLTDIFQKVELGAKTHQRGGGIGYDFSQLRPNGSPTSNDAIASGAVSFMDVFNAQTATILQGGRRGANMGVMNVYNMDIEEFINAKSYDEGKLNHFNVSVMVDDNFMKAVKNDEDVFLHYPVYNEDGSICNDSSKWKYSKKTNAKELWDLIIKKAYDNGEPGIFFYDNLNRDNNLWYIESIVCSNPCGEYVSGTVYGNNPNTKEALDKNDFGGACNLGSLFLHNFVENPFTKDAYFHYDNLLYAIFNAVNFLDSVIDINSFPDKIYENYQKSFRTIGLGITGLANALVMMNMKYNSEDAIKFVDELMNFIAKNTYRASIDLAKKKGQFPLLDREKFVQSGFIQKHMKDDKEWKEIKDDIIKYGIRNSKMLSVAPCGTLSLTYGNNCSSGLEPIFSLEYDRKVKMGGQSDNNIKIVKMQDYAYGLWKQMKELDKDVSVEEDKFVTAMNMTVDEHIKMLSTIAYHIDMSCSKTINVPTSYSFEETKGIYESCYNLGVKGCTIFRPNDIRQGILISNENKEVVKKEDAIIPRGVIIKADDNCVGRKRTLYTGCGTLHCEAFFDPINGSLLETYFSKGSSGGCNNFMIGLSRMISLASRAGVDIYTIVDQLDSCGTCPSYAVRRATKHDTSKGSCCPVAIGNALLDMYNEVHNDIFELEYDIEQRVDTITETKKKDLENVNVKSKTACPECGEELTFEGGCMTCKSCGWTKCE